MNRALARSYVALQRRELGFFDAGKTSEMLASLVCVSHIIERMLEVKLRNRRGAEG
jgi:hypothetical protein